MARAGLDSSQERDWGFDSLARAELLLRSERAFSVRLPERMLGEAETLRDLLPALLRARMLLCGCDSPAAFCRGRGRAGAGRS